MPVTRRLLTGGEALPVRGDTGWTYPGRLFLVRRMNHGKGQSASKAGQYRMM